MTPGPTEPRGHPPEFDRRPEKRSPKRDAVGVEVLGPPGPRLEPIGGEPTAPDLQFGREDGPGPRFPPFRDPAFDDHGEPVLHLQVAGKVDLPRHHIGQVPRQATPSVSGHRRRGLRPLQGLGQ